jgi:lysophospholipase L1-like esterase
VAATAQLTRKALAAGADPLWQWRRNYGKRHVRPVNVLLLGDSIPFGSGTAVATAPDYDNFQTTMALQLQRMLNGDSPGFIQKSELHAGVAGVQDSPGGGYHVPTRLQGQGIADPWRVAAGTVTSISRGFGLRSLQINAASRLSFTAPSATGFLWWYEDGASNLGTPGVTIYAGDYSTSPQGKLVTAYPMTMNTGLAQYTRTFSGSIQLPCRGKWTVEFTPVSGTPVLDGLYVLDGDLQQGVRVHNYAFGSQLAADFAASTTAANTAATASKQLQAFGTDGIDLVVAYVGANDYINNVAPATFQTSLETIVDKYRAAQTRPQAFLFVSHFARYDATTPTYPWSQYKAAMAAVKLSRTQVDYLDLEPWFPASQAADTDGDLVDSSGVHLTAAGQAIAAQMIGEKLTQLQEVS